MVMIEKNQRFGSFEDKVFSCQNDDSLCEDERVAPESTVIKLSSEISEQFLIFWSYIFRFFLWPNFVK
ncbi:Alanine dehydrogenase [Dirofilaria immitis]